MKIAIALVGLLMTASLVADAPPDASAQPASRIDSVSVAVFGPNVIVRGFWRASGNPTAIVTRLAPTPTSGEGRTHTLAGSAVTDTFQVARPAAGATIGGGFCVKSTRPNWQPSADVCTAWTYSETGTLPPPVLDSVRTDTLAVGPAPPVVIASADTTLVGSHLIIAATLNVPIDTWACTVYEMQSGMVGYRGPRDPACAYPGVPPSPAAQAWIDANACTTYAVQTTLVEVGRSLAVDNVAPCSGLATVAAR